MFFRLARLTRRYTATPVIGLPCPLATVCSRDDSLIRSLAGVRAFMRQPILLAAFAAIPLGAGCAIFAAAGPSLVPYQGRPLRQAVEERVGLTLEQLPHWAVSVAASISVRHCAAAASTILAEVTAAHREPRRLIAVNPRQEPLTPIPCRPHLPACSPKRYRTGTPQRLCF